LLAGDCLITFQKEISEKMKYVQKQGMQQMSKMRYFSIQFDEYLNNDLYLECAKTANSMAQYFKAELLEKTNYKPSREVQTNMIFVCLPNKVIQKLKQKYNFYVVDKIKNECRFICSFSTKKTFIDDFMLCLSNQVSNL
jgi:threonine aldolase